MLRFFNPLVPTTGIPGLENWFEEEDDFPKPIKALFARSGWGDIAMILGIAGHKVTVPKLPPVSCDLFVLGRRECALFSLIVVKSPPTLVLEIPLGDKPDPWWTLLWAAQVESWHYGSTSAVVLYQIDVDHSYDLSCLGVTVTPGNLVKVPSGGVIDLYLGLYSKK